MAERRDVGIRNAGPGVSELQEKVVYINRVSQGRQGRPPLLADGARRRRRRHGQRRRGHGQVRRGAARDQEGRRGREEEHVQGPAGRHDDPARRSSASSAPAGCCSSRPLPVPASSPAARSARCSSSPASTTCCRKSLGSDNALNMVKAAAEGLQNLASPEDIARRRGKTVGRVYTGQE